MVAGFKKENLMMPQYLYYFWTFGAGLAIGNTLAQLIGIFIF